MASTQIAVNVQPGQFENKLRQGGVLDRVLSSKRLLVSGIVVRVCTFIFLNPENVDGHWLVVSFIAQQGRIPHSSELGQAYHPPLYYLLVAPLFHWSGSFKIVQLPSLVFSVLTLIVLYRLIYHSGIIRSSSLQRYCFLWACFLPQFVMYTLFVSNDTLAIFLGCCLAACVVQFVCQPGGRTLALLTLVEILGLLTKATFLAYLPVVLVLVFCVLHKNGRPVMHSLAVAAAVFVAVAALGSYKEIDNYRQYHHAFVSNIDFKPDWALRQEQTYAGAASFLNFNLPHLILSPVYSAYSVCSYPVMLYATFWYQHVPECNFTGYSHRPFTWIASATYLVAVIPTLVFLTGLLALARNLVEGFKAGNPTQREALARYALVAMFLGNVGMLFTAVAKYHVWSIMQGRLLFPSFFPLLTIADSGQESFERTRWRRRSFECVILLLSFLFLAYLSGEMGLQIVLRFLPGVKAYLRAFAA